MSEPIFLTVDDVLYLHKDQIDRYGGIHGIRDGGLLASAVASPQATFDGKPLFATITEMAASYLYNIVQNHPFLDGNKRAGAVSCVVFLLINGYELDVSDNEFIETVMNIASSKLPKNEAS